MPKSGHKATITHKQAPQPQNGKSDK